MRNDLEEIALELAKTQAALRVVAMAVTTLLEMQGGVKEAKDFSELITTMIGNG